MTAREIYRALHAVYYPAGAPHSPVAAAMEPVAEAAAGSQSGGGRGALSLLPCEEAAAPLLAEIESARAAVVATGCAPGSAELEAYERLCFEMVRAHQFVKARVQVPEGGSVESKAAAGGGVGPPRQHVAEGLAVEQTDCQLDIFAFRKWLKKPEAEVYKKLGNGVRHLGAMSSSPAEAHCPAFAVRQSAVRAIEVTALVHSSPVCTRGH